MTDCPYVSRGGLKLAAALEAFAVDVTGFICADLGCNVGGFTDCLLQRGAAKVYAVDTGYGELAWKLRQDERVVVAERTNALHVDVASLLSTSLPPVEERLGEEVDSQDAPGDALTPALSLEGRGRIDLVVIDLGWTPQRHAIPAALRWQPRQVITLIKPHYEATDQQKRGKRGIMDDDEAATIAQRVIDDMPTLGVRVVGHIVSPVRGGAGKGKRGNVEYLALLEPV
jgi:23S rRNA (cytidine1920-2'-O)/16S rRNA (cytidine1409-2'-O)-methyltransferase